MALRGAPKIGCLRCLLAPRLSLGLGLVLLAAGCLRSGYEPEPRRDGFSGQWEVAISDDLDDGEVEGSGGYGYAPEGESQCSTFMGGYDLVEYGEGNGATVAFFRFKLPSAIPPGAAIGSVTLSLFGSDQWHWDPTRHTLSVCAELCPDAPRVTSAADQPDTATGRPVTGTCAGWGVGAGAPLSWVVGGWNTSPDLSAVVQEVVDRLGGLATGAHVQLFVYRKNATDNGEVAAEDFCHTRPNQARLSLSWVR
jgi:hypothetical protein